MSGSTSATFPTPTSFDTLPPPGSREGSKYVKFVLAWNNYTASAFLATINLLAQFQSGQFTTPQAILVDNSTNGIAVRVTCVESGWAFTVPAFHTGCYPLICGAAPEITVQLLWNARIPGNQIGSTNCYILNTPMRQFERAPKYFNAPQFITQQLTLGNSGQGTFLPGIPGYFYAIYSLDLSLVPTSSGASASNMLVELFEQATSAAPGSGGNYHQLWNNWLTLPASATPVVFDRQLLFDPPLLTQVAGNPVWLAVSSTTISMTTTVTLCYALLPIA